MDDTEADTTQTASRRAVLAGGVAAITAAVAGCSGTGSTDATETKTATETATRTATATATPSTTVVDVAPGGEFVFSPGTDEAIRIAAGTTVRFVWRSDGHNIVVGSQPSDANWPGHDPLESRGFELTHTFDVPGKYEFWCEPHKGLGMVGTLVVE